MPSQRVIALVGVSLEAAKAFPAGFPLYRDGAEPSKDVGEYMTENGLRETPEHSLYARGIPFKIGAGFDERIRRHLMGHRLTRERYGHGGSLEHLHKLLEGNAF